MKSTILLTSIILILAACKKEKLIIEPRPPQVLYTDLSSKVMNITTPATVDINGDGISDVWFEIFYTRDNNLKKHVHQFVASASNETKLLMNVQQLSPILNHGKGIFNIQNDGYEWKNPANVELAKRTLTENDGTITWEGAWKEVEHRYLAVQITKNGAVYNGWIELSFDTVKERVVLHRSGVSKEVGSFIVAGE